MQNMKMEQQSVDTNLCIDMAQQYIKALQMADEQQAENLLHKLYQLNNSEYDQGLYTKVGRLTRQLHDSMSNFMDGTRIQMMTSEDMPDARARLQHVVDLTEESAHKTISLIEKSNPLLSKMQVKAVILQQKLRSYHDGQKNSDIASNNEEIDTFLELVSASSETVKNDLNEIMLAQNYQDLTGQVIQRVSTLVQEVENNLLTLLQTDNDLSNTQLADGEKTQHVVAVNIETEDEKENKGYGPAVPGVKHGGKQGDVLNSQEEVDDLLSSLGF